MAVMNRENLERNSESPWALGTGFCLHGLICSRPEGITEQDGLPGGSPLVGP